MLLQLRHLPCPHQFLRLRHPFQKVQQPTPHRMKCLRSFSKQVSIHATLTVLVQPEMERGRSPLVSNSTLRAGIFRAPIRPPSYPSAWLRPRRARFRFARPDHCSSTTSIRLNFRVARDSDGAVMASLALADGCLSLWFKQVNRQTREETFAFSCGRTYVGRSAGSQ